MSQQIKNKKNKKHHFLRCGRERPGTVDRSGQGPLFIPLPGENRREGVGRG